MVAKSKLITHQVYRLLASAPATAQEMAGLLEVPTRRIRVALWVMRKFGYLKVKGMVPNLEKGKGQVKQLKLYGLSAKGRARLRSYRRNGITKKKYERRSIQKG